MESLRYLVCSETTLTSSTSFPLNERGTPTPPYRPPNVSLRGQNALPETVHTHGGIPFGLQQSLALPKRRLAWPTDAAASQNLLRWPKSNRRPRNCRGSAFPRHPLHVHCLRSLGVPSTRVAWVRLSLRIEGICFPFQAYEQWSVRLRGFQHAPVLQRKIEHPGRPPSANSCLCYTLPRLHISALFFFPPSPARTPDSFSFPPIQTLSSGVLPASWLFRSGLFPPD